MLMLLLGGKRFDPDTFIHVSSAYGVTLASRGQSVPVKAVQGAIVDGGTGLQKPVKSLYGYLLVTEV